MMRVGELELHLPLGTPVPKAAYEARRILDENRFGWPLGWRNLPFNKPLMTQAIDLARDYDWARRIIVLGIGGSALGLRAIFESFPPDKQFSVLDNVDPYSFLAALPRGEEWHDTIVIVISKSGTTIETMAQFYALSGTDAFEYWGKDKRNHIVGITDPDTGYVRKLFSEHKWDMLPVPNDIGGRFSVLCPVGTFPAALAGLEVKAMLAGAAAVDQACTGKPEQDPALQLAMFLHHQDIDLSRNTHVMMAYSDRLFRWTEWWRQLWAESIGKAKSADGSEARGCGPTPVMARGSTDQHSQLQLYMEGPKNKVVGFLSVIKPDIDAKIVLGCPAHESGKPTEEHPFKVLEGRTLGDLLVAELEGTKEALTASNVPIYEIKFQSISMEAIGAFIHLWQWATAYAGVLYDVNAFDQPGVTYGKDAAVRILKGK